MSSLSNHSNRRPISLCRSWVFLPGTDPAQHRAALASPADALIIDLEDSTPVHLRPTAHAMLPAFLRACMQAGKLACVRINPLLNGGWTDLTAALEADPDAILLPKTESAQQVDELASAIVARDCDAQVIPNVETAAGLVRTLEIASAHPRVSACLMASEDMTTSLGAERGRDGLELQYARGRFLVECRASGVIAIDCPYTFSDIEGAEIEARYARRLGYTAKSTVDIAHGVAINRIMTPQADDIERAQLVVREFEQAHAKGQRAQVDGNYLEVPIYLNAKRLLARKDEFDAWESAVTGKA